MKTIFKYLDDNEDVKIMEEIDEKIEDVVEKMEKNSVLVDHGQINLIRQMITTFHRSR